MRSFSFSASDVVLGDVASSERLYTLSLCARRRLLVSFQVFEARTLKIYKNASRYVTDVRALGPTIGQGSQSWAHCAEMLDSPKLHVVIRVLALPRHLYLMISYQN